MSDNDQIVTYKLDTALYGPPHPSFNFQDGDLVISALVPDFWGEQQSFRVHQSKLASMAKGLHGALLGGQEKEEGKEVDNAVAKFEEHEDEEDEPVSISTLDISDKHRSDKVITVRCQEDTSVLIVLLAFVYDDQSLLKLADPEHSFKVWKAALRCKMHALALYAESAMLRDKEQMTAKTAIEIIEHASKYNKPDVKKAVMPITVRTHLLQLRTSPSNAALLRLSTEDVLELAALHMHAAKYYPVYQTYKGNRDASLDKQVAGLLCRHPTQNGFGNQGVPWGDNSFPAGGHDGTW